MESENFDQEEQDGEELTGVFNFPPVPAITDKYLVIGLTKLHNWARVTSAFEDRQQVGASYEAVPGTMIAVAFIRPGKEDVEEDLPDGVILFDELMEIRKQIVEAERSLRDLIKTKGDF